MEAEIKTKMVDPFEVRVGDTIIINGVDKTVGRNTIKRGLFPDYFVVDGHVVTKVEVVLYPKRYQGKVIGYYTQI